MARIVRKILLSVLALVVVAIAGFAVAIGHDSPCGPAPAVAEGATLMRAVTRRCYGPPDVLAVEHLERPVPADNQMLVKVHAAGINPVEWHSVRGTPYIMRVSEGIGAP